MMCHRIAAQQPPLGIMKISTDTLNSIPQIKEQLSHFCKLNFFVCSVFCFFFENMGFSVYPGLS